MCGREKIYNQIIFFVARFAFSGTGKLKQGIPKGQNAVQGSEAPFSRNHVSRKWGVNILTKV